MDNQTVDVMAEGTEGIALVMKLIWPDTPGGKATHYLITKYKQVTKYYQDETGKVTHHFMELVKKEDGTPTLVLLWHEESETKPLPFPLDMAGATQFVQNWLKAADYGREPDHDGDNRKGWRIFTETWGHVAHMSYAIVAVQPAWAMYGK